MSNVLAPIGLDIKLQPQLQLGQGNSNHLNSIPHTSRTSSSSSLKSASKPQFHLVCNDTPPIEPVSFGAAPSSLTDHEESNESVSAVTNASCDIAHEYLYTSPFNQEWTCTQDFVLYRTPSRKDDITHYSELVLRRKGTSFIRQVANHLKLKPICKETAYIYFHRFYMLRSLKKYEPYRIGMACLYLACKFEDHPTFKEHLVRISYMFINRKDLNKADKEYIDWCERLIRDENLLLQVLGFDLQIRHFQVRVVEASQNMIEGTSKELYTTAYKIASEVNRLTMLCVEYPSVILACATIYLAAIYKGIALPGEWCASVKGATAEDTELVTRIGEEYKERIAKESDLVKTILKESGVKCLKPTPSSCSPGNSTPSHSMYFGKNDQLSSHLLTTFSPDSAYSSNSSHSPPENANYNSQSRNAQAHHSTYPSHMVNHHHHPQVHHKSSQQFAPAATYSSQDSTTRIPKQRSSTNNNRSVSSNQVMKSGAFAGPLNTQPNSLLASAGGSRKRPLPATSNLNAAAEAFYTSTTDIAHPNRIAMMTVGAGGEPPRRRLKSEHNSASSSKHQNFAGHNHIKVSISNNSSNRMMNSNGTMSFINHQQTSSNHYTSMPHF